MLTQSSESILSNYQRLGKLLEEDKVEETSGVGQYLLLDKLETKPWDLLEEHNGKQHLSWDDLAYTYVELEETGMVIPRHTSRGR